MAFKHEIFISYKWGGPRKEWVDKIFAPLLEEALDEIFPDHRKIFKDTKDVVQGATLDDSLKDALAHSKCMVSIVSLPYFTKSVWCPTEFSAMLYREQQTQIRAQGNRTGFIFPVIFVDDDEKSPEDRSPVYEYPNLRNLIFNMTPLELDNRKFNRSNDAFIQSNEYNELRNIIRRWVRRSIRPVLTLNLEWREEWKTEQFLTLPYLPFSQQYHVDPVSIPLPSVR